MQSFSYILKDEDGLHARPAGLLVKEASKYQSTVYILKGDKKADCKRLFSVMSLAIKQNDCVIFNIEGIDEEKACAELEAFCRDTF